MPNSLSIIALFSFTSLLYNVVERANAEAEVIVQIEHGNLTADTEVFVETLNGSSATGMSLLSLILIAICLIWAILQEVLSTKHSFALSYYMAILNGFAILFKQALLIVGRYGFYFPHLDSCMPSPSSGC